MVRQLRGCLLAQGVAERSACIDKVILAEAATPWAANDPCRCGGSSLRNQVEVSNTAHRAAPRFWLVCQQRPITIHRMTEPIAPSASERKLLTKQFGFWQDAELCRQMLVSADIPAYLHGDHGAANLGSVVAGWYRVEVAEEHWDAAEALVEELETAGRVSETELEALAMGEADPAQPITMLPPSAMDAARRAENARNAAVAQARWTRGLLWGAMIGGAVGLVAGVVSGDEFSLINFISRVSPKILTGIVIGVFWATAESK
jgi:Putative prokaryotic signal transducing protein